MGRLYCRWLLCNVWQSSSKLCQCSLYFVCIVQGFHGQNSLHAHLWKQTTKVMHRQYIKSMGCKGMKNLVAFTNLTPQLFLKKKNPWGCITPPPHCLEWLRYVLIQKNTLFEHSKNVLIVCLNCAWVHLRIICYTHG